MHAFLAWTIPGLDWLGQAFAYALKFLYDITGNFGLAIILLTIAMRIVILPLTIKQTKSMIAMQRLQPQLKEIQKKYKDDREKQGQEMMKLYKENKVSPLGGCLPLILQLPIIFAVFDVLNNLAQKESKYIEIIGANTNLTFLSVNLSYTGGKMWSVGQYWQVIVLILFTIATGYVSAKMMTTDPKQSKLMALMPVLMGVFAWILPAGVTLYIIVTNVLTILQQYVQLEREGYYDERRKEWMEPEAKWNQTFKLRLTEYLATALTAVRIKPRHVPEKETKKKPAAKASKAKPAAKKPSGKKPSGKKPSGKKPAQKKSQPGGKKTSGKKPSGKQPAKKASSGKGEKEAEKGSGGKSVKKDYPAKKQTKGKK